MGRCSEVVLPARSAAVRVVARTGSQLGCPDLCGLAKAPHAEEIAAPELIQRPVAAAVGQEERRGTQEPQPPRLPHELGSSAKEAAAETKRPGEEPAGPDAGTARISVHIARAAGLPKADWMGTADPYVELRLVAGDPLNAEEFKPSDVKKASSKAMESRTLIRAQTQVIRGSLAPAWAETFTFDVPKSDATSGLYLYFRVYDYDMVTKDDFLAHFSVSLLDALTSSKHLSSGWRALLRQCPAVRDRLEVLSDQRLRKRAPISYKLQEVPGQEGSYDLKDAEMFVDVDLPVKNLGYSNSSGLRQNASGFSKPAAGDVQRLQSELVRAAMKGDSPAARRLLAKRADVNFRNSAGDFAGFTPLQIASRRGHVDLAMALVEVFESSLVQPAPGGLSVAMLACEAGSEGLCEWLITEGVPADLKDDGGRTVLHYAAKNGLSDLTPWLLSKQKLAAGERAQDGATPLLLAAAAAGETGRGLQSGGGNSVAVVQQLLEAKALANAADSEGRVPLHAACEAGDDTCVRLLVQVGKAKVDALDAQGRTALDFAKVGGIPSATVKKLLQFEAGDDWGTRQRPGETALEAEKREDRARKAALSAEMSWTQWRTMHPRRPAGGRAEASGDAAPGSKDAETMSLPEWWEEEEQDGKAAIAWSKAQHDNGGVPLFVGASARSSGSAPAGPGQSRGRLSRLTAWARSLRKPSKAARAAAALAHRREAEELPDEAAALWHPSVRAELGML